MPKFSLAIATALLAFPAAAAAQEARSLAVSYADLDLSTAAGIQRLDGRVRRAVESMCGEAHSTDLAAQAGIRRCREAAWTDYAAQRPVLIAARSTGRNVVVASR